MFVLVMAGSEVGSGCLICVLSPLVGLFCGAASEELGLGRRLLGDISLFFCMNRSFSVCVVNGREESVLLWEGISLFIFRRIIIVSVA
jgi:hypothetical protein